jgi:formyl-CoA transferase
VGFAHLSERGPEQQAYPLIDHAASMLMAWGVAAALYHRERTGAGQKLDVALMQAAMLLSNNWLTHVDAIDGWREEFLSYLKTAFAEGKTWAEVLKHRDELQPHRTIRAYYGFFDTADGSVGIACNARTLRLRMIQILGIDDRWTTEPGWLPDDVEAHEVYVREQVLERLKANTSAHWIEVFRAKGLPIGPVRLPDEMFDDQQAWDNEFFARVEHELLGGVTVVGPPVKFSETPLEAKPSPPLGKHTREALREGGLNDEQIAGLFERGVVREINPSTTTPTTEVAAE